MMVRPIYLLILRGVGRCGGITGWEVLCTSLPRGVRGHAPPENFENMDTLRRILGCFYPIPEERHKLLILSII